MIINQCQLEQGWNVRMIDLCHNSFLLLGCWYWST
jgi:hypothetical protein